MKKVYIFLPILYLLSVGTSLGFVTTARTALVVENSTGDVLLSKQINKPIPPASMSKLMTLWMVFEALDQGKISLQDELVVSKKAWKKGGSKMFLRQGEKVSIENLLRGVIIQSGNDACIVLAEGLAGTEDNFAELMTNRARGLGLSHSTFSNSTGWPHPHHKMSSSDLIILANQIRTKFPQYYKIFQEKDFTWDGITQKNRNPMLYMNLGADGFKTGYTEEAGYGLIASAEQKRRRISFVITGLGSNRQRAREAKAITTWAFNNFKLINLFKKNEHITSVPIWLGTKEKLEIASSEDTDFLGLNNSNAIINAKVILNSSIVAPVMKGDAINGKLVIKTKSLLLGNEKEREISFPLIANETIYKGGLLVRIKANFRLLKKQIKDLFRIY
tara:strand:- start:2917 stop:4083 length:1167 start_codon:yes stop_codon:yes gene_type:complete